MTKLIVRSKRDQLIEILKDPDRKPIFRIIYDLSYLFFIYKELPVHYFSRYLFKKGVTNIKDYVPNKVAAKVAPFFNEKKAKEVIDNKLYFDLFYRQFNISLPRILMYNHKNMFVVSERNTDINNLIDFKLLLGDLFEQNPALDSIFIKKTFSSASGRNIFKLSRHQLKEEPETINKIYSEVVKSEYLFQETVKQHPDLNKLNPSSLNTIRFDTFIDRDGKIDIISGFLKMSTNNSHVDNNIAGGCGVGIDSQTGRLKKYGYSKIKINGVGVLTEHPKTKTIFENFIIPYFPQAKEMVLKTACYMPGLRLVGWDVGIAETGPVLIEGNSDYGINSNDLMYGGYMANPAFRKVLQEINYLR